jgi:hypothetical protein
MAKDAKKPDAKKSKDAAKPAVAKDAKKPKEKAKDAAVAAAPVEKPVEAPRPPADPRLKYVKKFHGRFLPRGPLRDRHTALFARWNSGEDHGDVSVEELKSLFEDWKVARQKGPKKKPATTA